MPIRKSIQLNVLLFVLGFFAILSPTVLAVEESITLTTYYPSPYGVYNEMRLYPHSPATVGCNAAQEGLMYYDNSATNRGLRICKCVNPPSCTLYNWESAGGWSLTGNAGTNPATNFIGTTDAQDWVMRTNNAERVRVTVSGDVGIGTTSPNAKLHVSGDIRIPYSGKIKFGNTDAFIDGGGGEWISNTSPDGSTNFGLRFIAGSQEAMRVTANNGNVGIGTTNPGTNKLEVSGTAQLRGAAGGKGLYVDPSGNVGIGTTSPGASLHILGSPTVVSDRTLLVLDGGGSRDAAVYLNAVGSDGVTANGIFESSAVGGHGGWTPEPEGIFLCAYKNNDINQKSRVRIIGNPITFEEGSVGIGAWNPTLGPLEMGSGAYCSAGGIWTDASSKTYKKDIAPLALDKALTVLRGLNPVTFRYKRSPDEQSVGFIAEDVPELVATKDRTGLSPMDIVAVLTKVVQQQEREINDLKQEVGRLKKRL